MKNVPQLLPYQKQFLADPARFKIGLWARQTGKDFTCTCEAVLDCLRTPKTTWLIVAAGERQALESLEKARDWAEAFGRPIDEFSRPSANTRARASSAQIKWSNGSRILALPANPGTIRGYSANLILTEFAFHEDPEGVWRAIYPSISNPLRGGVKKLRIISTPNGYNNKFADLWLNTSLPHPPPPGTLVPASPPAAPAPASTQGASPHPASPQPTLHLYHRSKTTIHDAVAAGLPLDLEQLRCGLGDDQAWQQEYLCEFADNSTVLFPYHLLEPCESPLASESASPQSLSASALPGHPDAPLLYAGVDFARKNHLTVCWIIERVTLTPGAPPVCLTREVLTLQDLSTPEQIQLLLPRLQRCQRLCVDYTGPGIGFGDCLLAELRDASGRGAGPGRPFRYKVTHNARPPSRLELCTFTSAFKAELFPRLRHALEARELLIPASRDIREDLHSIYRTVTHSGQILYRAFSTPDGHADRTTALALALRAVQTDPFAAQIPVRASSEAEARDLRRDYPIRVLAVWDSLPSRANMVLNY